MIRNPATRNCLPPQHGTTYIGGSTSSSQCSYDGCGTVYSVGIGGAEKILHRFSQASDGQLPEAGLVNVRGIMYGTTDLGGDSPPEWGRPRKGSQG